MNWGILVLEGHDGVHDIVAIRLEGLDGLGAGNASLGHDELNVLLVDTLGALAAGGFRGSGSSSGASRGRDRGGLGSGTSTSISATELGVAEKNVHIRGRGLVHRDLVNHKGGGASLADNSADVPRLLNKTELLKLLASLGLVARNLRREDFCFIFKIS
jgi:hypothetical protein